MRKDCRDKRGELLVPQVSAKPRTAPASDLTPFKLSRVFAEGWNAARNSSGADQLNAKAIARLNPYVSEPARSRWIEGFNKAQED